MRLIVCLLVIHIVLAKISYCVCIHRFKKGEWIANNSKIKTFFWCFMPVMPILLLIINPMVNAAKKSGILDDCINDAIEMHNKWKR